MKLHNALVETSRGSQGLGCGGETTGAVFCKKNGVGTTTACKALWPGQRELLAAFASRRERPLCRKQPGRGFHKDLLFGCSDYISVLAIERHLAFGFCFQLYLFLPVLNSLCEYRYSESPRMISAFIKDSFQLPFNCLWAVACPCLPLCTLLHIFSSQYSITRQLLQLWLLDTFSHIKLYCTFGSLHNLRSSPDLYRQCYF